jgi:enamine deaminase RidA (YjgF/YER057c/UK114 family)
VDLCAGSVRGRPRDARHPGRYPRGEAEQLFTNLAAILAAAGPVLTDVVPVGIVMRALQRDRPVFNQVWAERFGQHRPARSVIDASDFGRKGRTPGSRSRWPADGG